MIEILLAVLGGLAAAQAGHAVVVTAGDGADG
jgi:hypothetical protein